MEFSWESHYKEGGASTGTLIPIDLTSDYAWRYGILQKYAGVVDDVVDVGCGDLLFWNGRDCCTYTGIDISQSIIEKNRSNRPSWVFHAASADVRLPVSGNIALCFDMLFRILSDMIYEKILENLGYYSKRWIFIIYTWCENPWNSWQSRILGAMVRLKKGRIHDAWTMLIQGMNTDGVYQKYRDFRNYVHILEKAGFYLIGIERPPNNPAGMYIFRKNNPVEPQISQ